ncbi:MAG: uroporphyrinogen decarboxylase family protein [Bacillota bacterium]
MEKREIVFQVLQGLKPEVTPWGELLAPADLTGSTWEEKSQFWQQYGAFLVVEGPERPAPQDTGMEIEGRRIWLDEWGRFFFWWEDCPLYVEPAVDFLRWETTINWPEATAYDYGYLRRWRQESDLFVFALLDGPYQLASTLVEYTAFLNACENNTEKMGRFWQALGEYQLELARRAIQAGAQGIIIADDFANQLGPVVPGHILAVALFPVYDFLARELERDGITVLLHCDGDLRSILPALTRTSLRGIQGLEWACGQDLGDAELVKLLGNLLVMGNLDPGWLEGNISPEEFEQRLTKVCAAGRTLPGGHILATSSGLTRRTRKEYLDLLSKR